MNRLAKRRNKFGWKGNGPEGNASAPTEWNSTWRACEPCFPCERPKASRWAMQIGVVSDANRAAMVSRDKVNGWVVLQNNE